MTLINIILPKGSAISQTQAELYTQLCQFKGELLSYFEMIEVHIGVVILAPKHTGGVLEYAKFERKHLSKSTTTRKISKAVFVSNQLGYTKLSKKLEYFRKVLWLRNFLAHSNFCVRKNDELSLIKRSGTDQTTELVFDMVRLTFITSEPEEFVDYWNNTTIQHIEAELTTENTQFVELIENYLKNFGITEVVYY